MQVGARDPHQQRVGIADEARQCRDPEPLPYSDDLRRGVRDPEWNPRCANLTLAGSRWKCWAVAGGPRHLRRAPGLALSVGQRADATLNAQRAAWADNMTPLGVGANLLAGASTVADKWSVYQKKLGW